MAPSVAAPGGVADSDRRLAAAELLDSNTEFAHETIVGALTSVPQRPEVLMAIFDAIASNGSPASLLLFDPVLEASLLAKDPLWEAGCRALGQFPVESARTVVNRIGQNHEEFALQRLLQVLAQMPCVESVDAILPWLDDSQPDAVRAAATEALVRVTGQNRCGSSMLCWQAWWRQNRAHGNEGLIEGRLRALERDVRSMEEELHESRTARADLLKELLAAYEREYVLTVPADRGRLLIRLLREPRADVRVLGLDLVTRSMTNAQPLESTVADAVADLTMDADPQIRAKSFSRLAFLNPQRAAEVAVLRLPVESGVAARRSIHRFLTSNPNVRCVQTLLTLWETFPDEREDCGSAILSALKAGLLTREDAERLAAMLVGLARDLTPHGVEMLAWTSSSAGADLLREALRGSLGPDRLLAAARGLAESGQGQSLLREAAENPAVYPFAVESLTSEWNLDALRRLLELPAPSTEQQIDAVRRVLLLLPDHDVPGADDLVAATGLVSIDVRQEFLRSRLDQILGPAAPTRPGDEEVADIDGAASVVILADGQSADVVSRIILQLARLQLIELHRIADALDTLARLPGGTGELEEAEGARLIMIARLAGGLLSPQPGALTWKDWSLAISIAIGTEGGLITAQGLIDGARGLFETQMTAAELDVLDQLEVQVLKRSPGGD